MKENSHQSFAAALMQRLNSGVSNPEAREECYQRITAEPSDLGARLLLAKLFYLDGYPEFSIRELMEIKRRRPSPSLETLLKSFGSVVHQYSGAVSPASATTSVDAAAAVDNKPINSHQNNVQVEKENTIGEIDFDLSIFDEES